MTPVELAAGVAHATFRGCFVAGAAAANPAAIRWAETWMVLCDFDFFNTLTVGRENRDIHEHSIARGVTSPRPSCG